jgi:hypothetical protein
MIKTYRQLLDARRSGDQRVLADGPSLGVESGL